MVSVSKEYTKYTLFMFDIQISEKQSHRESSQCQPSHFLTWGINQWSNNYLKQWRIILQNFFEEEKCSVWCVHYMRTVVYIQTTDQFKHCAKNAIYDFIICLLIITPKNKSIRHNNIALQKSNLVVISILWYNLRRTIFFVGHVNMHW